MSDLDLGRVAPPKWLGALSGVAVALGFTIVHNVFIADIWFNVGPMLTAGALCGFCVTWSYRKGVTKHSNAAWFQYAGLYAAEMIALGAVSLVVLRPRFTMAELMVADDALEQLMPPSVPLMIGAMVVGTILIWLYNGRRRAALAPIAVTQVLLVFLLGHQFAFLGLVESSSALLVIFSEFALFTVGITAAFCFGVMWSTKLLERLWAPSKRDAWVGKHRLVPKSPSQIKNQLEPALLGDDLDADLRKGPEIDAQ